MYSNPFTSEVYQKVWKKHFARSSQTIAFNFLKGLNCYRASELPFYINLGKNDTGGVTYEVDLLKKDYKNKTILIYDVPSNLETDIQNDSSLKLIKVKQYFGSLLNLDSYRTVDAFWERHFNSKSRKKYRGYINRIARDFTVSYKVYKHETSKSVYEELMFQFKLLLENRFDALGMENDIILKWSFYKELVFEMLLDKKAVLHVMEIESEIGAISLSFLSENKVIGAIKAFDTKYKNYSIGIVELIKLIEWSLESNYKIFDFSKGDQAYKKSFVNETYFFNAHIYYDSASKLATLIALALSNYFEMKQYLRNKNINTLYWKLKHKLKIH